MHHIHVFDASDARFEFLGALLRRHFLLLDEPDLVVDGVQLLLEHAGQRLGVRVAAGGQHGCGPRRPRRGNGGAIGVILIGVVAVMSGSIHGHVVVIRGGGFRSSGQGSGFIGTVAITRGQVPANKIVTFKLIFALVQAL